MQTADCQYLGYIAKTIGFEGSVLTIFEAADPSLFGHLEYIFILFDGKLVPFFVDEMIFRAKDKEVQIFFEDVDTDVKARKLCNRKMYLPKSLMPSENQNNNDLFQELNGFRALLEDGTYLGDIKDTIEYPSNPVFLIRKDKHDILIPANEDLIVRIDRLKKEITLSPPEGLLDIYLK